LYTVALLAAVLCIVLDWLRGLAVAFSFGRRVIALE
jgi:hypothetical protein